MLRIFTGRAGSGKSAAIMNEIKQYVLDKKGGSFLLVPEQYSHEAERELCSVCGDSLSLYAEVLSFCGLWRKLSAELGGSAAPYLDNGGRLLCMALAADGIYSKLSVYSAAGRRAELQSMLLSAVDELKAACIDSQALFEASLKCEGALSDKLHDLSYILEAFDSVVANGHADPADKLSALCDMIPRSSLIRGCRMYFDGFTDFTVQELRIIEALLISGADVTVCLGCDSISDGSEFFELSRITARRLKHFADENHIGSSLREFSDRGSKSEALSFFADNMFTYSSLRFENDGDDTDISISIAPSPEIECEFAAARAVSLVRDTGCRWRDIAVAVRGFDEYRPALEDAFHRYGVPLYTARKSDMFSKPLPAMISAIYEIVCGGWDLGDILDYLRTGLAGLDDSECDTLENYALLWQLSGSAWTKNNNWHLHPDGYGGEFDDDASERLNNINMLRKRASAPLLHFAEAADKARTASEQARALSELLCELHLAERLEEKAEELNSLGRAAEAQEYSQLWEITVSALEQCYAVLGETEADCSGFGRLFTLMLSKYDVGSIPAALDCVTAGDFDRMRRRNIKHLIVIGASESRLPQESGNTDIFSDDEKHRLSSLGLDLGGGEAELWREFALIYNCLTLPSETLSFCFPAFDGGGEAQRESFVLRRAKSLFGIEAKPLDPVLLRANAPMPALTLAANSLHSGGDIESAAAELFSELAPEKMCSLREVSKLTRGRLSPRAVTALYGNRLRLSASRIDKFSSCKFSYFMQYGLKAKPRASAGFSAPEVGIFMHYILENVAKEVKELGGFRHIEDDELNALTDKYVTEYIKTYLNDFKEKSKRFEHLFRRLINEVRTVVNDMADELRRSDFEPLSFELNFGDTPELKPRMIGEGGDSLALTGIADRVDGWIHDGKLYLRVMDYKTGVKKFSLSDVWYGMGLQMLLYLFTLEESGSALYGMETVPAGVLYIPAKDTVIKADGDISDDEISKKRLSNLKRSGLILNDPAIIYAMENSDTPEYIPVKIRNSVPGGDCLVTAEQLGLLSRHIDRTLQGMAEELRHGSISADPYYRSAQDNACTYCDYFDVCHFAEGEDGEHSRSMPKLKAADVWEKLEGGEDNV